MTKTVSASGSAKAATSSGGQQTPFDQITQTEEKERKRLENELSGMQKEHDEVEKAVSEKEAQATDELKATAKGELKEFSEKELKQILKKGEKDATAECEKLEADFLAKKSSAAKDLATKAIDPKFLLS
jgi:hypothetical protein